MNSVIDPVFGRTSQSSEHEIASLDDQDDDLSFRYSSPASSSVTARNDRTAKEAVACPILFTNGLGLNVLDYSELHAVVEMKEQKMSYVKTNHPIPKRYTLAERWGKKSRFNFCADVIHSLVVVSQELGFTHAFDLCQIRGWLVTLCNNKRKDNDEYFHHIEYKRFKECLASLRIGPEHKAS